MNYSKKMFPLKTFFFILLCTVAYGQMPEKPKINKTDHSQTDWFLEIQKPNPDFNKVQTLYDAYFKVHPYEKSTQRSIAVRWFQTNSYNTDAKGIVQSVEIPVAETQALMKLNNPKNTPKNARVAASPYPAWNDMTGTWRMIGPYHGKDKDCKNTPTMSGGFNDRVYINPYNTQNLFAGQSYGGLWVSKDQGTTWKLTDAEFPNGKNTYANRDVYYGEIEASKMDANLIYAGTEAGLLKSTNGGDSWALASSLNYVSRPTERAYFVALANHDANMLLASYGKKIYRSTDGGANWTMVFDNSAGGSNYSQGQHSTTGISERKYNFAGLTFHPTKNNVAYIAAKNSLQKLCIYRSIDYGQTWNLFLNTNRSEPFKMEVPPAAPDKIYFFQLFTDLSVAQTVDGIIKYDTSGVKVQSLKYPVIGHLLDDCTVSHTDSTVLYLGGYSSGEVHKSTNGGLTFFTNNGSGAPCTNYVHSDVRGLSAVGNLLLIASDGGNSISTDGMTTLRSTGEWISGIDQWGFSSGFKGDIVASGDDHGPTEVRWFDGDSGWEHDGGADSQDLTINPAQPRWIYAADIYRKYRMITKDTQYDKYFSVVNASFKYLAIHPNIYGVAFPANDKYLMRSVDNMATVKDTLYTFPEKITKVKIALKNPAIFYVLTNNKDIYKSLDSGRTFSKKTPSATVTTNRTNISDIEVSNDGQTIWLSYGQVQNVTKVVKSGDGGQIWVNYSTGLPSPTASNITMQRGTDGGVYVSTNGGGVWYRDNTMNAWALLGNGLPMLGYITSAYVVPDKKAYRMGTSRGAFEHPLAFDSKADAIIAVDKTTTTTCRKDTLYFRDYSAYQGIVGTQFQWTFQGGIPAVSTLENPKVVYPNTGTFNVSLTVTDAQGNISSQTLNNFITVIEKYCGADTLRGNALKTTAQSQYMQAVAAIPNSTNTYSMMAWVKGTGTQVDYAGIMSLKSSTGNVHLNVRNVGTDSTQIGYHHPNGQWWFNTGLYLKPNIWTHLALVVEPNKISVVKDGIRVSHTGLTVASATFSDFYVGTMLNAEWYRNFIGEIDEVAVYNRALTDTEIRNMMHLTKNNPRYPTQSDAGLLAYYQFNENDGNIYDRIGSKDGTLTNASRTTSTAPVAGGEFQTITTALSAGINNFTTTGLSIKVPSTGTKPTVPFTIYRLHEKPYPVGDSLFKHYWVWRNWTTAKSFAAMDSIYFKSVDVNSSDLSNPANYSLYSRPVSSYSNDWILANRKAVDTDVDSSGTVSFSGTSLTSFGQLILSRNANPCLQNKMINMPLEVKRLKIQATEFIKTQGNTVINLDKKVEFKAGNYVQFDPNFEATKGTFLKVDIGGCDNK
jgi:Concanavalin A-like lectin/glucanases superfamily/PKD domain